MVILHGFACNSTQAPEVIGQNLRELRKERAIPLIFAMQLHSTQSLHEISRPKSKKNAVYVSHYSNHLICFATYVTQFQTRELLRQPDFLPPTACRPPLALSPAAAYLTATPSRQPREFMVDWRKVIQAVGSLWYLIAEESTAVMLSEVSVLSPTLGNKEKKKVAKEQKANGRQRA